jgi:TPR repeat protein
MNHFLIKLLAMAISFSALAQTALDGRNAISEQRYGDAVRINQPLAERGDPAAQFQMGILYLSGWGLEKNYAEALKWLQMAANNENKDAQYMLGNLYYRGQGVSVDFNQSFFWRKKAADNKHPFAAFDLAEMYMNGIGVQRNISEAKKYYQQLANATFKNAAPTTQEKIDKARAKIVELDLATSASPSSNSAIGVDKATQTDTLTQSLLPPCPPSGEKHQCFGEQVNSNSERYIGEFEYNKPSGQGTYSRANGSKYVGEWKDGKQNGRGIQYRANNSIATSGIFVDGKISTEQAVNPSVFTRLSPSSVTSTKVSDMKQETVDKPLYGQQVVNPVPVAISPLAVSTTSKARVQANADDQEAFKRVKALASTGDTNSQVQLGNMYDSGQGAKQDSAEAVKWYKTAANKGDAGGRFMLGAMYDAGRGVKQSYAEALKWYRLAADQGNAMAQDRLGQMFSEGVGVNQSYTEGLKWLQRAAERGNANSQVAIGDMYSLGKGVPQNYSEAATWYRMAASKGDPNAQYALGGLYRNGRGVVQDNSEALKWYQMAAAKGDAKSNAAMDSMQIDMAAKQRVLDQQQRALDQQQQRIAREQDARRQQAEESRRQAEQTQQQQQQDRDRAEIEKKKCLANATERLCYMSCLGVNVGVDRTGCQNNCKNQERANVAACNGIFLPPVPSPQQIIIQQGGGDPNPFPNMNKCIKDGGTLMCR